jgi:hypothetical protein
LKVCFPFSPPRFFTIIADDPTKLRIECLMLHHLGEAQVKSGEIGDGLNTLEQAERSPILVPILVGRYAVSEEKTDTYSVKGNNAEIRHDLARLARMLCTCRSLACPLLQPAPIMKISVSKLHSFRIIDFVHSPIYPLPYLL